MFNGYCSFISSQFKQPSSQNSNLPSFLQGFGSGFWYWPYPESGCWTRIRKNLDPDPEKFKNWIRIQPQTPDPDPKLWFSMIELRGHAISWPSEGHNWKSTQMGLGEWRKSSALRAPQLICLKTTPFRKEKIVLASVKRSFVLYCIIVDCVFLRYFFSWFIFIICFFLCNLFWLPEDILTSWFMSSRGAATSRT